jgi:hypothetical protein
MGTERTPASVPHLVWANLAALLLLAGCTALQPECSEQVDPGLLTRVERAVFILFEDEFGRELAEKETKNSEIREARTCGDDVVFEYWPVTGWVGTVYSMTYDATTGKAKVTGVD